MSSDQTLRKSRRLVELQNRKLRSLINVHPEQRISSTDHRGSIKHAEYRKCPSPLINLNPEIWRLIVKKLDRRAALKLRRVNKDFKIKVDNFYEDWSIYLNEDYPYLDTLLDLRVKIVDVRKLLKPVPNRPQGMILKYPDLITELKVPNTSDISGENLHIFLQCKNLKNITIALDSECNSNDEFWETLDPQIGFNFPQLQTLDLTLPDEPEDLFEGSFYERLMTLSVMPNLQSLKVCWEISDEDYALTLLKFIDRHGRTIKHFAYEIDGDPENFCTYPSLMDHKALLRNCSTLETLKIGWIYHDLLDVLHDLWKELIQIQSKLNEIELSKDYVISSKLCANIAANNYETLTKVDIEGVKLKAHEARFNMSIFSKCMNLRDLKLKRYIDDDEVDGNLTIPTRNLHTLPQQIETIELENFSISSEDFTGFFKRCNFLSSIVIGIHEDGETAVLDVNFLVLQDILTRTSLKYVEFDLINLPESRSEVAKMNEIYFRMVSAKYGEMLTNYFDTKKWICLKKSRDSKGTLMWFNQYMGVTDSDESVCSSDF